VGTPGRAATHESTPQAKRPRLREESRFEFWILLVVYFLDSLVLFTGATFFVFLALEPGVDRAMRSTLLGGATLTMTASTLLAGPFTDWLGIRRSLLVSLAGKCLALALVASAGVLAEGPGRLTMALVGLYLYLPFRSIFETAVQAAKRRFTTTRARPTAFYLAMLVGTLGGVVGIAMSPDADVVGHFDVGMVAVAVGFVLVFAFVKKEEQLYGADEERPEDPAPPRLGPVAITGSALSSPVFWRLMLFTALVGTAAIAHGITARLSLYVSVVGGSSDALWALVSPSTIASSVSLLVCLWVSHRFNAHSMAAWGGLVAALSVLVLLLVGHGPLVAWVALAFVCLDALARAISARLHEYLATAAPVGQEGTYFGLAFAPISAMRHIANFVLAAMFVRWVPQGIGARLKAGDLAFSDTPAFMWILVALLAAAGPLLALRTAQEASGEADVLRLRDLIPRAIRAATGCGVARGSNRPRAMRDIRSGRQGHWSSARRQLNMSWIPSSPPRNEKPMLLVPPPDEVPGRPPKSPSHSSNAMPLPVR